ncbi:MAG: bacteriocin immunity protein [Pseudobacteriovorax sp.]|nr:bacteriocin immunity protein [Pseudobacteriovorax sp.]
MGGNILLSDKEVIELIDKLRSNVGTEDEEDEWLDSLSQRFPNIQNLIFHSKERLTAEQILEKAKEIDKPILL